MKQQTLLLAYPAIITPDKPSGYLVQFPDLPNIFTGTNENNLATAINEGSEALGLLLADYIERGKTYAEPSKINEIKTDDNQIKTLITTDVSKYMNDKMVKKTLTIPEWADRKGKKLGINFSNVLTQSILTMK